MAQPIPETLPDAIAAGLTTWALVWRGKQQRQVRGEEVRDDELLSWTYEGAPRWFEVARVVWQPVGTGSYGYNHAGHQPRTLKQTSSLESQI